ncbi:MAG: hypothetical protein Q7S33_05370 [Nanoarchaeota archaeon]|nr:hypothetical protein [Nanoarchaeota archaeon]
MEEKYKKQDELPDFQFPLFVEDSNVRDIDLENKLPLELFLKHEGYEIAINQKQYVLSIDNYEDFPRDSLKLEISTFRGMCHDAIHFYGFLELPLLNFKELETNYFCGGYGIPSVLRRIQLHRSLTTQELNLKKYNGYELGEMINGFNSIEDIIVRAKVVAEKYFQGFKLITSTKNITEINKTSPFLDYFKE